MTIHILVFPFPAQGHMIPILDLTDQLLARGLAVTVLVTPKNVHFLDPLESKHPSMRTLVLPFPEHPLILKGVENVKDLPHDAFFPMISVMGGLKDPIIQWFKAHPSPPVAIISDFFLGWTNQLASQLGIPRVVFSPSGALALSILYSLWSRMPPKPVSEFELFSFDDIPSGPIYPWWQLSPIYRSYKKGDPASEFIKDSMIANTTSWGVIVNTFEDFESSYLRYLEDKNGQGRVWFVGPVLPSGNITDRGGSSSVLPTDLSAWLDKCHDNSVLYICFGSQAVLSTGQMKVVSAALELSGVKFVWGVKEPSMLECGNDFGVIPAGFENRVAGKGLVIRGWVPQVTILNHRAIGSFLTHCGWNSVVESIAAGIPMLAWPMGADQFTNTLLLVDQGVGILVCEGRDTIPNENDLAQAMTDSLSENCSRKARVLELSRAALDSVKVSGKSFNNLNKFIETLSSLHYPSS